MATNEPGRPAFVNPNPGFCRTCNVELANRRFQYCTEHRPAKTPPQRRAKSTRIADAHKRGGTGAAVLEVIPGGKSEKKQSGGAAPSTTEWDEGLGKVAVGVTWAIGMVLTRGEPREIKHGLAVELSMTDDEATAVVHPIAARFAGTSLNAKHGRKILETLALSEPVIATMQYLDRVHEYRFERAQREAAAAAGGRPMPYAMAARPSVHATAEDVTERPRDDRPTDDAGSAAAAAVPPITGYTGGAFGVV